MSTTITATAKSKRELARLLGKSESLIRKWIKDDRWPFEKVGPWDVVQVQEWARLTLAPDPSEPSRQAARQSKKKQKTKPVAELDVPLDEPPLPGFEGAADDVNEERRVNIQLKRERMQTARWERERDQGLYVAKTEVQRRWHRIAHDIKTELLNLPEAAVAAMQGLSEQDQRDVLRGRILEVLRHLVEEDVKADEGNDGH